MSKHSQGFHPDFFFFRRYRNPKIIKKGKLPVKTTHGSKKIDKKRAFYNDDSTN